MLVPDAPVIRELRAITPSIYEALLVCKARADWTASGSRDRVPQHPSALLGTGFHSVVEQASRGRLPRDADGCRAAARDLFDSQTRGLLERAHPLLRAKFPSSTRLPFYYLFRERAAVRAV